MQFARDVPRSSDGLGGATGGDGNAARTLGKGANSGQHFELCVMYYKEGFGYTKYGPPGALDCVG